MPFISRAASCLTLLVMVGCGSTGSPASPGAMPTPAEYLAAVLDIMQANSFTRKTIDWPSFRQTVTAAAPNPQTIADTYPAIAMALDLLNDLHGTFRRPDGSYIRNPDAIGHCNIYNAPTPVVPPDIGYVKVGTYLGPPAEDAEFAAAIQRAIAAADNDAVRGWIVDIRGDHGGNMYPMIAGVGPVLGEGTAGSFIDADDKVTGYWGYANGAATYRSNPAVQVPSPYTLRTPLPKVAVLTDCTVASSGEAVVISFLGRPNTRSFGTATYGASTSPHAFDLPDGGQVILAVSVMADRNLTKYGGPLVPNEVIDDPSRTVERAIQWLR